MSEKNVDIDDRGNISNKFKLAMAFNIWRVLDRNEYESSLEYIDKNKWVLFTLVMSSYKKLIFQRKKTAKEVVCEIAWATGYIIPQNFDYRYCGYDINAMKHLIKDKYTVSPNVLKNSIDIDLIEDDGEEGSVLYELKPLPLSCWLNLKDTIKKYNKKWEEDIRTNLYQWMGAGYEYVLDFYSFINLCAYYNMETKPLESVWNSYMKPSIQKPLIYIAKDFPEYRTFWESWYNELYKYSYEIFSLAGQSFSWNASQMQERKKLLVNSRLWEDFVNSKNLSVNRNEISIDTENFAEKWLGKPLDSSSDKKLEFHGFFTSKKRNINTKNNNQQQRVQVVSISMDEIKEIASITAPSEIQADLSELEQPKQETPPPEPEKKGGFMEFLKGFFSKKEQTPEPQPEPEEPPEIKMKNKYLEILEKNADNPVFKHDIKVTKEHIDQIQSRLQKINGILSEHFKPSEMTYARFARIIEETATRFYANVRTMIKRIDIFDTKDYLNISRSSTGMSVSAKKERMRIYTEHIEYVHKIVDSNENIISKLDGLLLELTKLDDFSEESLNNNPAINELTALIDQTKYYKQ